MDHAAWLNEDTGEEAQKAYAYFMRPDPDQREFTGPIQEEEDPLTGKVAMFREGRVGMTRNAKDEDMKPVKVYLGFDGKKSLPHIRLSKAKELLGWYQSAINDKPGSRPRPCYTEAVLTEPYGGYCTVGCAFSLPQGEPIITPSGPKEIQTIKKGDFVWGRTALGLTLSRVTGTSKHWKPEGFIVLNLTDGRELRLTADHPVYSADRRTWVNAGDLSVGERLEDLQEGRDLVRSYLQAYDGESARQETAQSLQDLRESYAETFEIGVRSMSTRSEAAGAGEPGLHATVTIERCSEINRNSTEDVGSCAVAARGNVQTSFRPEDSRMEAGSSRARTRWNKWLSNEPTRSVSGSLGTDSPDAERLGSPHRLLAGQKGVRLGLRARGHSSSFGLCVYSRFSSEGRKIFGNKGLRRRTEFGEGIASPVSGVSNNSAGEKVAGAPRRPAVEKITRVDGGLYVYDIETETENFYHNGILSHNCYVNSGMRGYRGSGLISVPIDYGQQVHGMLSKMRTSAAGYFSSYTDPFIPLEDIYHNTQQGAMEFVRLGLPVFFLSRMSYPGWAYDILAQNKYSYAQKSLNCSDPDDWAKLSPGALPLMDHMDEIRELRRRGIYVSIQVNPIIAGVTTHEDIERLLEMLAEAGANHVICKFVEAGYSWAPAMVERIMKRFGDNRGSAFRELFVENSCGSQKNVIEAYRREGFERYRRKATQLGLTFALCYEYGRGPDNKWRSLGPDYMTSDQCHGHRVPMFTRNSTHSPSGKPVAFREVSECPPSGCLTCASGNEGKPRCGNEERGEAKAMRFADYKNPVR